MMIQSPKEVGEWQRKLTDAGVEEIIDHMLTFSRPAIGTDSQVWHMDAGFISFLIIGNAPAVCSFPYKEAYGSTELSKRTWPIFFPTCRNVP